MVPEKECNSLIKNGVPKNLSKTEYFPCSLQFRLNRFYCTHTMKLYTLLQLKSFKNRCKQFNFSVVVVLYNVPKPMSNKMIDFSFFFPLYIAKRIIVTTIIIIYKTFTVIIYNILQHITARTLKYVDRLLHATLTLCLPNPTMSDVHFCDILHNLLFFCDFVQKVTPILCGFFFFFLKFRDFFVIKKILNKML